MAKVSNSAVVLLLLLIAAWRTTPVMSHAKPTKPADEPGLDYGPSTGRRYVFSINPPIAMHVDFALALVSASDMQ
jgi:hypothetical protein